MTILDTLGSQPISSRHPAGTNVRNDPDFVSLRNEISLLFKPTINIPSEVSCTPDWRKITQLSVSLLSNKGKDVLVACYLVAALLQEQSLTGLRDGLKVLHDMFHIYWDTMHPTQRPHARHNALEWLLEYIKLHGAMSWPNLPPQEEVLCSQCQCQLQALEALLQEKDHQAPSFRPISLLLSHIPTIQRIPEKDTVLTEENVSVTCQTTASSQESARVADTETEQSPNTIEEATIVAPSSPQTSPLSSPGELEITTDSIYTTPDKTLSDNTFHALATIAQWHHDNDSDPAMACRLRRIIAWSRINTLPPTTHQRTQIPPPSSETLTTLHNLHTYHDHQTLIQFSEAQLLCFPFWLDLNYLTIQALSHTSHSGHNAQREIKDATWSLLRRLPTLENLQFSDGMPFANTSTRQWLQSMNVGNWNLFASPLIDSIPQDTLDAAEELASNCDIHSATIFLQKEMLRLNTERARLQLRLYLCKLLLKHHSSENLTPFAQSLLTTMKHFQLYQWEPEFALDIMLTAYRILAHVDTNKHEADALLKDIIQIDMSAALSLIM